MSKTYIVKNTFIGAKNKEGIVVMELPNKDVLVIVGAYYYLENRFETPESPMTFEARVDLNDRDAIKKMLRKLKKTEETYGKEKK